jgi:hypothetical protein
MKTQLKTLKLISFHTYENRVIRKVRKTQYQNPEFGHTQGEIKKKKPAKKYISIQQGMKLRKPSIFGGKLSFILSFLSPEGLTAATYISQLLTVQLL